MSEITRAVGTRIAGLRKNKKMTQAQLAEKAEISPDFISRIERGTNSASLSRLHAIAKALDIQLNDLFEHQKENPSELELQTIVDLLRGRESTELRKIRKMIEALLDKSSYVD